MCIRDSLGPFDARVAAEDRERITRVLAAGGRGRTGPVSFLSLIHISEPTRPY